MVMNDLTMLLTMTCKSFGSSPVSDTVISSGADGMLYTWDAVTGRSSYQTWIGGEGVLSLALSRDGRQLVAGCKDGVGHLREVRGLAGSRRRFNP